MPRHDSTKSTKANNSSMSGEWMDSAKKHPVATAAAAAGAAGAVAAGVYLWSRRHEVGEQMSRMTRKAGGWAKEMHSDGSTGSSRALMKTKGPNESDAIEASRATSGQSSKTGANMNAARSSASTVSY